MPVKEQARDNDKTITKQRTPQPSPQIFDNLVLHPRPAAFAQRPGLDPKSLNPRDMLQLQRTIGNQPPGIIDPGHIFSTLEHALSQIISGAVESEDDEHLYGGSILEVVQSTWQLSQTHKIVQALGEDFLKRASAVAKANPSFSTVAGILDKILTGEDYQDPKLASDPRVDDEVRKRMDAINTEGMDWGDQMDLEDKIRAEVMKKFGF